MNERLISDATERILHDKKDYDVSQQLIGKLFDCPIPIEELQRNLFLFLDRRALSRFLFLNELYLKAIGIHGSILELGVRYGVNLAMFTSLRGIYEPFNHNRKIIGFDTFAGFVNKSKKDASHVELGDYGVTDSYVGFLSNILELHESLAPVPDIKKHTLVKGDVMNTLEGYLQENPETLVSLIYFDMDLYEPTKCCLDLIEPYLAPGAVIGFDEINVSRWPGETIAMREWMAGRKLKLNHSPYRAAAGYIIYD